MARICADCKHVNKKANEKPCDGCFWDDMHENWEHVDTTRDVKIPDGWTAPAAAPGTKRPAMLKEMVPIYEHPTSEMPDRIRVSFDNGKTAVYDLHMNQPAPVIIENIRIIRRMKQGYVNQPMRRRNRK